MRRSNELASDRKMRRINHGQEKRVRLPAFHLGPDRSMPLKKGPVRGGALKTLPIDFYIHARTPFSPNFHIRFPDTPALLDGYVRFADGFANRRVGRPGAVFAAKWANAVSITYFCGDRGQRQKGSS